jgi:hypothetical protein
MARELFGPQWPASSADSAIVAVLEPIADAARVVTQPAVVLQPRSFDLAHPPDRCAISSLQY